MGSSGLAVAMLCTRHEAKWDPGKCSRVAPLLFTATVCYTTAYRCSLAAHHHWLSKAAACSTALCAHRQLCACCIPSHTERLEGSKEADDLDSQPEQQTPGIHSRLGAWQGDPQGSLALAPVRAPEWPSAIALSGGGHRLPGTAPSPPPACQAT